ncbi:hypothetical protein RSOLAG1IB_08817 [Rhizoctonia solani AG-1 IB]|uniref:FAS1 domain-containing protein n=1 Tax=Thanatephorus cucumeris (strain AG1-IB / isolate 7/3/14) TaxID=1108050 RepID=A0A0B7FLD6_THACB|nr:hypothetical protein RSOLAG1IB_08817 [Rhizoctonia solani AG-1 IB]
MKFLTRFVPALLAASGMVRAASIAVRTNDDFFSEFIDALNKNNLTILANSYERINNTYEGREVIDALQNNGEVTVLAPENESFESDYASLDKEVLLYNTIWGNIDKGFENNGHKLSRRKSTQTRDVVKTGQKRPPPNRRPSKRTNSQDYQVQVIDQLTNDEGWKRSSNGRDPLILIDRAVGSAKVIDRFSFRNIVPLIKSAPNGLVKFSAALKKAGLLDLVDDRGGRITLFAPVDDQFCDIDKFSKDELASFLKNHFFFGKIVFSPIFTSVRKATAESGKQLEFSYENDIHYVCCGKDKAVVLRSDVVSENGVLHVIDRPLKCD